MSGRETPAADIPVFDMPPAFEEETRVSPSPGPVARSVLDGGSAQGEQLRLLATRLRALGRDKRLRRIGIVGATAGEGASTVALGLAEALASERRGRVLLLELDLDRPALDLALGLGPPEVGLREYLDGKGETPVVRRLSGGFWLLSAGDSPPRRRDLFSSPRLEALLKGADRVFDRVVVDCPPLVGTADATPLPDLFDGFVFVVRARHAARETVREAAARLRPGRVIGLVLNARRHLLPRRPGRGGGRAA
ncbi:MAG TPA: CpsD/CapB family tyrosine-protein kinase [Vicinamibacteria bacterium]|nr:CpsD/CapB family tyrosine-protein kinase [Vicinamibacteria bacterium]